MYGVTTTILSQPGHRTPSQHYLGSLRRMLGPKKSARREKKHVAQVRKALPRGTQILTDNKAPATADEYLAGRREPTDSPGIAKDPIQPGWTSRKPVRNGEVVTQPKFVDLILVT